jgi:hypothetical protein
MRSTVLAIAAFTLLAVASAEAGSVSLRLVEASNSGGSSSGSLSDVIGILQKNLPFKTYTLKASGSASLPASSQSVSLDGYSVTCNGSQENLSVAVKKGSKTIVNTSVALKKGKPFVLGGLPGSGGGSLVLILVAR